MLEDAGMLKELGSLGVLGVSFLALGRWMLGNMTSEFKTISRSIRVCTLVQNDMHRTLLIHDAQVRGVNPLAGSDPTDAHLKAHDEYQKLLAAIENTRTTIEKMCIS